MIFFETSNLKSIGPGYDDLTIFSRLKSLTFKPKY